MVRAEQGFGGGGPCPHENRRRGLRLLALDASTTAVGWALFVDGDYRDSGVFVPRGSNWYRRILEIRDWLADTCARLDPDTVAYEVATGRHGNLHTDRILGAVHWACWLAASNETATWHEVTASQVKASGCHKHALPVARAISGKALTGTNAGDEADAIGVALAALGEMRTAGMLDADEAVPVLREALG